MNTFLKISILGLGLTGAFHFLVFFSPDLVLYENVPSLLYPVFMAFFIIGIGIRLKVPNEITDK